MGAVRARGGLDVTLLARGAHLEAMRTRGVRVREDGGEWEARPPATDDAAVIGPVDVVFLTAKAHSLPEMAPRLGPLLGAQTAVVSLQNGIPWWFFTEALEGTDPGGAIVAAIERRRVVGGIAYCSTQVTEPGVVWHSSGKRFSIGEPEGGRSQRCRDISRALVAAGLHCPVTTHIREEIWTKLLGNVAFNPISALTGASMAAILREPATRTLVREVMCETEAVGTALGIRLPITIDQRMAGAEQMGEHKTSMLQDLEAGRSLELEPIVGAVLEVAGRYNVPVPRIEALYACAKLLAARGSPASAC
jgi:2-dehydropantoate 2-reductase